MYPKHPAKPFVSQGTAKLRAFKVRPGQVSKPGRPKTGDFKTELEKYGFSPKFGNFFLQKLLQFGSPLRYKDL